MEMMVAAIIAAVLFVAVVLWELPTSLAPAALCFSMPRRLILPSMLIALAAGLCLGIWMGDKEALTLDVVSANIPVSVGAAIVAVAVFRLFSLKPAVIPSISAAVFGSQMFNGIADPDLLVIPAQWLASMLVAAILGMLIFRFMDRILENSTMHLLMKLSILGTLMSVSVLLMMVAIGMNISCLVTISLGGMEPNLMLLAVIVAVAALALASFSPLLKNEVSRLSDETFDTDAAVSVSCVIATALTMLIFARGTVISPAVVMLCAFAGAKDMRSRDILMSVVAAPLFALLLSYTVSAVAGSVAMGESLMIAQAVSGLLAIVCCLLVALMLRMRQSRPAKVQTMPNDMNENYRRLNEMKVHSMQIENEHLQNLLEIRRRDAISIAERISEQSGFIDDMFAQVTEAEMTTDVARKDELLHQMKSSLSLRRNSQDDRSDFYSKVEALHQDFSARLTEKCPQLSAQERKLATLLRLEFSSKYIAALLNISPKSVEVERHRLRKKLGLTREQNLIDYIKSI